MFALEVPEHAIAAFEAQHHLRVTVHDLRGSLWPFLAPTRFHHAQMPCQMVKGWGLENTCFAFDGEYLRRELPKHPDGFIKICHAGLVEWAVPVFRDNKLEWVLFAGVRRRSEALPPEWIQTEHSNAYHLLHQNEAALPAPITVEEAQWMLENLRQLAARLWLWAQENVQNTDSGSGRRSPPPSALTQRRTLIERYIAQNHSKRISLNDLARELRLSESRTSHAVRECCGTSWQQLLLQARLRTAMGLLRHSQLSVLEVALRSGFNDVRQFQRTFRQQNGTTPLGYRKAARS